MTTNRLGGSGGDSNDPTSIENMPGYVPPAKRKKWTPAEHCKFANDQLAWRGVNEYRRSKGMPPVRWVIRENQIVCELSPTGGR
jgi:hypothetical protein